MKKLFYTAVFITVLFSFAALGQVPQTVNKNFKVGEKVEATYVGDWTNAVIVREYQDTEFGYGTYMVKFDNGQPEKINAQYVRPRFRSDPSQRFQMSDRVEFRRWDDSLYQGEVVGIDGEKYEIRYEKNGTPTKEWVKAISVRSAGNAASNNQNASFKRPSGGSSWNGQKFNLGDRVMYSDGYQIWDRSGEIIGVDAEKRQYTVRDLKDRSWKYSYPCFAVMNPRQINNDFYIGKWDVRINGAITTVARDGELYRRYSGGMKLPPLEINSDHTYVWRISPSKIIRGKWEDRKDAPGIVLLNGIDGGNWTLYEKTEGFATTAKTRDEIGFHDFGSGAGYYIAYRVGANQSCVLRDRIF